MGVSITSIVYIKILLFTIGIPVKVVSECRSVYLSE